MPDFYTEMAGVATELLSPTSAGGLGQGVIKLVRYTPVATTNPWDAPLPPTRTETLLLGAARGVSGKFVGMEVAPGNPIVATDLQVIAAPIAGGGYQPGDVIEIDGKPHQVLRYDNIPAAGIVSAIRFIVRA